MKTLYIILIVLFISILSGVFIFKDYFKPTVEAVTTEKITYLSGESNGDFFGGDVAVIVPIDVYNMEVGMFAVWKESEDKNIIHVIVEVIRDNENQITGYITRGVANDEVDIYVLKPKQVYGRALKMDENFDIEEDTRFYFSK